MVPPKGVGPREGNPKVSVKMRTKNETKVYKGLEKQRLDKETIKACEIVFRRLGDMIRGEVDLTEGLVKSIDKSFRQYTNSYEYEDGWRVKKIILPDSSIKKGDGYHVISIVACTAQTGEGVKQAVKRATQVRIRKADQNVNVTRETVVVLSSNIDFVDANRARSTSPNGFRKVFVYSVGNALGVAKHVLNKFRNLFGVRAKAILALPDLKEGALKELAYRFIKRVTALSKEIEQLETAFDILTRGKEEIKKLRDAAWHHVVQARKWGVRFWLNPEDLYDLERVNGIICSAADRQGIDIVAIWEAEREAAGDTLFNAVPVRR